MMTSVSTVYDSAASPAAGPPRGGLTTPAASLSPNRPAAAASHPSPAGDTARDGAPPVAVFEIPRKLLDADLFDARSRRPVCIRWCSTHQDYRLYGKPRFERSVSWHCIRRATDRDIEAFKASVEAGDDFVLLDDWEHQRCGPVDVADAESRFAAVLDRACAEVLNLSSFWTFHRDRLSLSAQLAAKERLVSCLAGIRCYEPAKEAQQ